jgi:hypothetical protein
MRRSFALALTILMDTLLGVILVAAYILCAFTLISRGVDIFLSLIITLVVISLAGWALDHFLRLRTRTRWLARAMVGLPEFDEPPRGDHNRATDKGIRRKAALAAWTVLIVSFLTLFWALTTFGSALIGLGTIGLLLFGVIWLLLNGGLSLIFDAVEDRVAEDETLRRDGPDRNA